MNKILIIEDEDDIRKLLKYQLQAQNFKVFDTSDGKEGIKLVKEQKPNLIVLDMMMPGMDGLTVVKELGKDKQTKNIPIILITGAHDVDKSNLSKNVSFLFYKPFEIEQLISKIKELL